MEYAIKHKTHNVAFLAPYVARLLGLKELRVKDFVVKYHSNAYCGPDDNADNAVYKMTYACGFGDGRVVYFIPSALFYDTTYKYDVYFEDQRVATIGPMEWDVLRPKVYSNLGEYIKEIDIAVCSLDFLYHNKAACSFILNYYPGVFSDIRKTIINDTSQCTGNDLTEPVTIEFSSVDLFGIPIHEKIMLSRTIDNRVMTSVATMN